jgi:hypothetical protein
MSAMTLPVGVAIGAQVLSRHAVGDTVEARFAEILKPAHLRDACFMCHSEDDEFRAAVGGLMLSYGADSPEFARIEAEMRQLLALSLMIQGAEIGVAVEFPDAPPDFKPVGLMGMWRDRQK